MPRNKKKQNNNPNAGQKQNQQQQPAAQKKTVEQKEPSPKPDKIKQSDETAIREADQSTPVNKLEIPISTSVPILESATEVPKPIETTVETKLPPVSNNEREAETKTDEATSAQQNTGPKSENQNNINKKKNKNKNQNSQNQQINNKVADEKQQANESKSDTEPKIQEEINVQKHIQSPPENVKSVSPQPSGNKNQNKKNKNKNGKQVNQAVTINQGQTKEATDPEPPSTNDGNINKDKDVLPSVEAKLSTDQKNLTTEPKTQQSTPNQSKNNKKRNKNKNNSPKPELNLKEESKPPIEIQKENKQETNIEEAIIPTPIANEKVIDSKQNNPVEDSKPKEEPNKVSEEPPVNKNKSKSNSPQQQKKSKPNNKKNKKGQEKVTETPPSNQDISFVIPPYQVQNVTYDLTMKVPPKSTDDQLDMKIEMDIDTLKEDLTDKYEKFNEPNIVQDIIDNIIQEKEAVIEVKNERETFEISIEKIKEQNKEETPVATELVKPTTSSQKPNPQNSSKKEQNPKQNNKKNKKGQVKMEIKEDEKPPRLDQDISILLPEYQVQSLTYDLTMNVPPKTEVSEQLNVEIEKDIESLKDELTEKYEKFNETDVVSEIIDNIVEEKEAIVEVANENETFNIAIEKRDISSEEPPKPSSSQPETIAEPTVTPKNNIPHKNEQKSKQNNKKNKKGQDKAVKKTEEVIEKTPDPPKVDQEVSFLIPEYQVQNLTYDLTMNVPPKTEVSDQLDMEVEKDIDLLKDDLTEKYEKFNETDVVSEIIDNIVEEKEAIVDVANESETFKIAIEKRDAPSEEQPKSSCIEPEEIVEPTPSPTNYIIPKKQEKPKQSNKKNKKGLEKIVKEPEKVIEKVPDPPKLDQEVSFLIPEYQVQNVTYDLTMNVPPKTEVSDQLDMAIEMDIKSLKEEFTEKYEKFNETDVVKEIIEHIVEEKEAVIPVKNEHETFEIAIEKTEDLTKSNIDTKVSNVNPTIEGKTLEETTDPSKTTETVEQTGVEVKETVTAEAGASNLPKQITPNEQATDKTSGKENKGKGKNIAQKDQSDSKPKPTVTPRKQKNQSKQNQLKQDKNQQKEKSPTQKSDKESSKSPVSAPIATEDEDFEDMPALLEVTDDVSETVAMIADASKELTLGSLAEEKLLAMNQPKKRKGKNAKNEKPNSSKSDSMNNSQLVDVPLDTSMISLSESNQEKEVQSNSDPSLPETNSKNVKGSGSVQYAKSITPQASESTGSLEFKPKNNEEIKRKDNSSSPSECKKQKDNLNLENAKSKKDKIDQEKIESVNFPAEKLINLLETKMTIPEKPIDQKSDIPIRPERSNKKKADSKQDINESSTSTSKPQTNGKPRKSPITEQMPKELAEALRQIINAPKPEEIMDDNEDDEEEEEEFIEFKFTPRQVYLATVCQICKLPLRKFIQCPFCQMTSYCSDQHLEQDAFTHQPLCSAIQEIARKRGGHIYNNARILNSEDYRNLRIHTLNICENTLKRSLQPYEREIILFPRLCIDPTCREWKQNNLTDCLNCTQVAYCTNKPEHLLERHKEWCKTYDLYKKLVVHQQNHGRIEPPLPTKIQTKSYVLPESMDECLKDIYKNSLQQMNECLYSTLTQVATVPLSALYASQLSHQIIDRNYTIHLIGAELQFEADSLEKWETFFLHLIPQLTDLRVVFVGPELNMENLPLEILSRIRMCRSCRPHARAVKFDFQCGTLYHDYVKSSAFAKPDIICFFNPGLYRFTGFNGTDTWPDTIKAATALFCPILVTSYTEYEAPQDLERIQKETCREIKVIKPPSPNPYSSQRPERNFISDEVSPMIFKNFYHFVVN